MYIVIFFPMAGFEQCTSDIGSDYYANWATTNAKGIEPKETRLEENNWVCINCNYSITLFYFSSDVTVVTAYGLICSVTRLSYF